MVARKTDGNYSSSMSDTRREILRAIGAEEAEGWVPIKYHDEVRIQVAVSFLISLTVGQAASTKLLDQIVAPNDTILECTSTLASMI